jgi:hypothetical protein
VNISGPHESQNDDDIDMTFEKVKEMENGKYMEIKTIN